MSGRAWTQRRRGCTRKIYVSLGDVGVYMTELQLKLYHLLTPERQHTLDLAEALYGADVEVLDDPAYCVTRTVKALRRALAGTDVVVLGYRCGGYSITRGQYARTPTGKIAAVAGAAAAAPA